jgi:hypothetical protein
MSNIVLKKGQLFQNGLPVINEEGAFYQRGTLLIDRDGIYRKKAILTGTISSWTGAGPYTATISHTLLNSYNINLLTGPNVVISFYWDNSPNKEEVIPSIVRVVAATGDIYVQNSSNAPLYYTILG